MKFILEIELGNASMSTAQDLAVSVMQVAKNLDRRNELIGEQKVYDLDGNRVGLWRFIDGGALTPCATCDLLDVRGSYCTIKCNQSVKPCSGWRGKS